MSDVRKIFIDFSYEGVEIYIDLFSIVAVGRAGDTDSMIQTSSCDFYVPHTVDEIFEKINNTHREVEQWNN